ncbi:MAG: hypothetical protein CL927_05150 [Deltaproteobacteria bacterium]|nr:hypothetical protein [Deltaproteobacteria bacterium]HCH63140.1 hypothetical protein [Deltaproteobacteria bacterium]
MSSSQPNPGSFVNPWSHGSLIRYLAWLRQTHSHLPLPAPDADPSEGVALAELYVPPLLGPAPGVGHGPGADRTIDLLDVLDTTRQVVLLGEPGSGRTTLLSWLVHSLTDPGRNMVLNRLGRMVPIVVPVRALPLHAELRTLEELLALLGGLPFWFEGLDELLPDLLVRGQVLFILDDADAIEDLAVQEALREAIFDGIERFPANSWVLSAEAPGFGTVPIRDDAPLVGPDEPRVARWYVQPWGADQVKAFSERWADLAVKQPLDPQAMRTAIARSHLARRLSLTPAMLAVLAVVFVARGDIPEERSTLLDWLVAGWLRILDNVPGSSVVAMPVRRAWVEAMARAAEAERIAAWDPWLAAGAPSSLESRVRTPPVAIGQAVVLLQDAARSLGAAVPDDTAGHKFVLGAAHRPGILVARGGGVGFVRPDHQRFLAAVHVAVDLQVAPDDDHTSGAAMATVRGWSRMAEEQDDDLSDLLQLLGERHDVAQRVYRRILETDRDRSLGELDDLGPLALALQDPDRAVVPEEVRGAARNLVDEAVRRWAGERGRVPKWARSLEPMRGLRDLPTLNLSGNPHVEDLYPLANQKLLYRLDLNGCSKVADIAPLSTMPQLQWADLYGCAKLDDISPLYNSQWLRWLDLGGCTNLTDLAPLGGLQGLQALALHNCTALEDLAPLTSIRSLRALVLTGCSSVYDLAPLRMLPPGGTVWVKGSGVRVVPPGLQWSVRGL